MYTYQKPQEAREIEARGRAKALGVRVEVVMPEHCYRTRSQSEPGTTYHIVRISSGWACECKGWVHSGVCKHVAQVERRSEREGWNFGRVAPRPVA